jgi:hypothetical protein
MRAHRGNLGCSTLAPSWGNLQDEGAPIQREWRVITGTTWRKTKPLRVGIRNLTAAGGIGTGLPGQTYLQRLRMCGRPRSTTSNGHREGRRRPSAEVRLHLPPSVSFLVSPFSERWCSSPRVALWSSVQRSLHAPTRLRRLAHRPRRPRPLSPPRANQRQRQLPLSWKTLFWQRTQDLRRPRHFWRRAPTPRRK